MPIHDWTRVDAGTFHDFHLEWIRELKRALNSGLLPTGYYAMAEQYAAGFGSDVLALEADSTNGGATPEESPAGGGTALAPPKVRPVAEADRDYYRRKQNVIAVRHVSGDRVVAVVEVVSAGNKSSRHALRSFVEKMGELLEKGIHLLVLDLHPPGPRDPDGLHAAVWEDLTGQVVEPSAKPLTLAAYESGPTVRAFVEPVAVGDALPDMPLFLVPNGCVEVPLEATYAAAFASVPRRWQAVLDAPKA